MIFNIPANNVAYKKYKDSLETLHLRLNGHIDNMAILFKDITKQKNDNTKMYLPEDTFEKNQSTQPYEKDIRKSSLVYNLY